MSSNTNLVLDSIISLPPASCGSSKRKSSILHFPETCNGIDNDEINADSAPLHERPCTLIVAITQSSSCVDIFYLTSRKYNEEKINSGSSRNNTYKRKRCRKSFSCSSSPIIRRCRTTLDKSIQCIQLLTEENLSSLTKVEKHLSVVLVVTTTCGRLYRSKPGELDPCSSTRLFGEIKMIKCRDPRGSIILAIDFDRVSVLRQHKNYPCQTLTHDSKEDLAVEYGIFFVAAGSSSFDPPKLIYIPNEMITGYKERKQKTDYSWPIQRWQIQGLEGVDASITCLQFIHKDLFQHDDWKSLFELWRKNICGHAENKGNFDANTYFGVLLFGHCDGTAYSAFVRFQSKGMEDGQIGVHVTQASCVLCLSSKEPLLSIMLLPLQITENGTSRVNQMYKIVITGSKGCVWILNPMFSHNEGGHLGFVEASISPVLQQHKVSHNVIMTSATPIPSSRENQGENAFKGLENTSNKFSTPWVCSFLSTDSKGSSYTCHIEVDPLSLSTAKEKKELLVSYEKFEVRKDMVHVSSTWHSYTQKMIDSDDKAIATDSKEFEIVLAYTHLDGGLTLVNVRPQLGQSCDKTNVETSFSARISSMLKKLSASSTADEKVPNANSGRDSTIESNTVIQRSLMSASMMLSSISNLNHKDAISCRLNASGTALRIDTEASLLNKDGTKIQGMFRTWSCHFLQSLTPNFLCFITPPSMKQLRILGRRETCIGQSKHVINVFHGGTAQSLSSNVDDDTLKMDVPIKNAYPAFLFTSVTLNHIKTSNVTKTKGRTFLGTDSKKNFFRHINSQNIPVSGTKSMKFDSLGVICQLGASSWTICDGILDIGVKLPPTLKEMSASEILQKNFEDKILKDQKVLLARDGSMERQAMTQMSKVDATKPFIIFSGTILLNNNDVVPFIESPLVTQIAACTIILTVGTRHSDGKDEFYIDCALGGITNLNELESIHALIESSIKRRLFLIDSKAGGKARESKLKEDKRKMTSAIKFLNIKVEDLRNVTDAVDKASTLYMYIVHDRTCISLFST